MLWQPWGHGAAAALAVTEPHVHAVPLASPQLCLEVQGRAGSVPCVTVGMFPSASGQSRCLLQLRCPGCCALRRARGTLHPQAPACWELRCLSVPSSSELGQHKCIRGSLEERWRETVTQKGSLQPHCWLIDHPDSETHYNELVSGFFPLPRKYFLVLMNPPFPSAERNICQLTPLAPGLQQGSAC